MHRLIQFFQFGHLPSYLWDVSQPCQQFAALMDRILPASEEKDAGLRKLLEAKDCFIRAKIEHQITHNPPLNTPTSTTPN